MAQVGQNAQMGLRMSELHQADSTVSKRIKLRFV